MFGLSFEHLILLGIVLLIFGPRRLPELGNTMGKAIRNFKDAVSGVEEAKYRHLGPSAPNSGAPQAAAPGTASAPTAESPSQKA